MNALLRKKAEDLASALYPSKILCTKTTDGDTVYFATCPDLPGCLGQGSTLDEAKSDLHDARIDYLYSLLEDGLPIPAVEIERNVTITYPQALEDSCDDDHSYAVVPLYGIPALA